MCELTEEGEMDFSFYRERLKSQTLAWRTRLLSGVHFNTKRESRAYNKIFRTIDVFRV